MTIVQSAGQLAELESRNQFGGFGSRPSRNVQLYNSLSHSYAQIIRTQPNVRTVISFIARNLAQLGVGLYEKRSETDRAKIGEHVFAEALRQPNLADRHLTTYRLMHRTVWDICAYDMAFWAILPVDGSRPAIQPLRPDRLEVLGHLWPTGYKYTTRIGKVLELAPDQVVYFQASHDLDDPIVGTSPIETLRRIIAEDEASGGYREQFWRSGARISGIIERPAEAPDWSDGSRDRFKSDWAGLYTGNGESAGGTPILEDGMVWKEAGTSDARSAQYIEARKLSREESAAAYHVDPIWVGIAGAGLSFSSVVERHKALYQDTLGPWVVMLEQDLTAQALPAFESNPATLARLYVKLNISEKLRGSVEDQAESLMKLVGRPILTVNEGRGLLERNDVTGGDGLVVPLNVQVVGESDPQSVESRSMASAAIGRGAKAGPTISQHEAVRESAAAAHVRVLVRTFNRQRRDVLGKYGVNPGTVDIADLWDAARWDAELEADLFGLSLDLAGEYGSTVAEALGFDGLDTDMMIAWLSNSARIAAENINVTTANAIGDVLTDEDPTAALSGYFDEQVDTRADVTALSRVTFVSAFIAQDVAGQAGRREKTWIVTSSNSRHPEMDGDTAPLGEPFSNGMQYPGDATDGVDQTAGCTCLLGF